MRATKVLHTNYTNWCRLRLLEVRQSVTSTFTVRQNTAVFVHRRTPPSGAGERILGAWQSIAALAFIYLINRAFERSNTERRWQSQGIALRPMLISSSSTTATTTMGASKRWISAVSVLAALLLSVGHIPGKLINGSIVDIYSSFQQQDSWMVLSGWSCRCHWISFNTWHSLVCFTLLRRFHPMYVHNYVHALRSLCECCPDNTRSTSVNDFQRQGTVRAQACELNSRQNIVVYIQCRKV